MGASDGRIGPGQIGVVRIQQTLADLYDLDLSASVEDFLCDEGVARAAVGEEVVRGEVLVVAEESDGLAVGLYVDPRALEVLEQLAQPGASESPWTGTSFEAWCLATEGVSHFVYLMFRAENAESVSQLELEVQAEVDKYATGLLTGWGVGAVRARSRGLRRRLFDRVEFRDGPTTPEGERYRIANRVAARFAATLEERHVARGDLVGLARALRRFYRLGAQGKLEAA